MSNGATFRFSLFLTVTRLGANNTYFTVERSATASPHMKYVDLLAVGSGLTGTLGNGLWSSANGSPVKVKT